MVFSVSQSSADIIGKVGPVQIITIIHHLSGIVNFLHGQATVERGIVLNESDKYNHFCHKYHCEKGTTRSYIVTRTRTT